MWILLVEQRIQLLADGAQGPSGVLQQLAKSPTELLTQKDHRGHPGFEETEYGYQAAKSSALVSAPLDFGPACGRLKGNQKPVSDTKTSSYFWDLTQQGDNPDRPGELPCREFQEPSHFLSGENDFVPVSVLARALLVTQCQTTGLWINFNDNRSASTCLNPAPYTRSRWQRVYQTELSR
ncbi:hypothetical protein TREES_T100016284 [Tupaia chinensis]|uniref:Uncharacterized protein n=1 Tax=Tupaia chinensis TaxID=246437 RepID=L9JDK3_TUPCH|nr:hypothetical protein TREES_T100016284 [Tupaia chinensis]